MTAALELHRTIDSASPGATRALGERLARVARRGDVITLIGELGAGKTQLAAGFGRGLGVTATINSPSFVLMAEYAGRLPLFHLDLYRLRGPADALASGLFDERQLDGVTIIEWADRLAGLLPPARLDVVLEGEGGETRIIRLRATERAYRRYLDAAA